MSGPIVASHRLLVGALGAAGLAQRLEALRQRRLASRPVQRALLAGQLADHFGQVANGLRQNLDLAISKWDRVLELDPNNRNARLKREQALDLKKRMAEKFGAKK